MDLKLNNPDGTKEAFEVIKVPTAYPVRLQTEPTGPGGSETVIFSNIDTYGSVRKPNLPGWVFNPVRKLTYQPGGSLF